MTRWLVLVEIDAATPLDAEVAVGIALTCEAGRKPFVRQTQVRLPSEPEAKPKGCNHEPLPCPTYCLPEADE